MLFEKSVAAIARELGEVWPLNECSRRVVRGKGQSLLHGCTGPLARPREASGGDASGGGTGRGASLIAHARSAAVHLLCTYSAMLITHNQKHSSYAASTLLRHDDEDCV